MTTTTTPAQRGDLLTASDEQIDEAVEYADPMVLRGLLYQLTGDEELADIPAAATRGRFGNETIAIENPEDLASIRAKAATFLKTYRDSGAGQIEVGPRERLPRSLALIAGRDIPEEELELWLEELALDRWARGLTWEEAPPVERLERFSVVVIGAGMGGLNAAVQLKRAGIPYTVIEKNTGVGGTWFENRYPGARVDSPSRAYTHLFGVDYVYPNPYCGWEENEKYFNWIADEFDVREDIVFGTEVQSVVWDEDAAEWEVKAKGPAGPRVWRANAVFSAVGFLSRPSLPDIEGIEHFRGQSFHTARWPQDLSLAGKRFAVIGTGCSGYQTIPEIALEATHVYVFQRTPQWLFPLPGYRSPFPPQMTWLDRNLPFHTNFMRFRADWGAGGFEANHEVMNIDPQWEDVHTRSAGNKRTRDGCIAFLEHKLASRPELIEKMTPPHPPMSARPVLVDAQYSIADALTRENVTLETEGIRRITPDGIETSDGREIQVDVIVFATGFRATDFLWPMEVRGRGRTVEQLWSEDGPRAYRGVMMPGFPNFFVIYGPNTNVYNGMQLVQIEELVTRFALDRIKELVLGDKRAVDVTEAAYACYNELLDDWEARKIYSDPRAHNYFRGKYDRSPTNCGIPGGDLWRLLREPSEGDLIFD
jgi:4-hydroxyacetophenone monooxygenase